MARIEILWTVKAPREAVIRAATAADVRTGFADPVAFEETPEGGCWTSHPDGVPEIERTLAVSMEGDECRIRLAATWDPGIPYFGWAFAPAIRHSVKSGLNHMAATLVARATGAPEPAAPNRPLWAPPEAWTPDQARIIATVSAALALSTYCGSLFSHSVDYVARFFGSGDPQIAGALAMTRVGTLVGVIGSALADRRGRRKILLASVAGACIASLMSAGAPNLGILTALQTLVRGFVNLATVVGFIVATEESPEGARAYTLAVASLATGFGFAVGAALLPAADIAPGAYRGLFALGGAGLILIPGLARRLPESSRFQAVAHRVSRARVAEIIDEKYRGRFATVAATVFLMAVLAAPTSQLMNRYLADERGYSGLDVLLLRLVAQAVPALVAVLIGGRLAESSGRKRVATYSTYLLAGSTALVFLTGGVLLWVGLLVATVVGALSGPSFAAFNTELFPTEARGTAGAGLLGIGVAGSVAGLLIAGNLASALGSLGRAIALTALAPLFVAAVLIHRLPEARGLALDEVSPPEV